MYIQLIIFEETEWVLQANILVQDEVVGSIHVFYIEERNQADEGPLF